MHTTQTFLLVAFIVNAVQSQSWSGIYTADSSCSTSACCCLTGQVVLTSSSTNTHTVISSVSGVCGAISTFSGTAYTNGYTGWMMVGVSNDTLTLSSDSRTITVTNPSSSVCNGKGVKNGAIKSNANNMLFAAIALFAMMVNGFMM